jgi:nicotinamidase-related amidase
MPLTKIDPTPALVVIDLQKGIVGLPTAHPVGDVIQHTAQLARAFRKRALPVVLVNVTGMAPGRTDFKRPSYSFPPDFAEFVPELEQHPDDYVVTKQRPGAFIGTSLDDFLRQRAVTQIVLTGVATSMGVEATARSAYDHGYHVVFVEDAMTDLDADSHRHSLERTFPRLGETDTTENVLKLLGG